MMNKGIFYLLPFLALTQVVSSEPLPQGAATSHLNGVERIRLAEAPKSAIIIPKRIGALAKPVSGRNSINAKKLLKVLKPREGRNVSRLKRKLIRR